LTVFTAALAVLVMFGNATDVQGSVVRHGSDGDLFYNYYSPPVGYPSVGAQLYVSPRPAPPVVGHTYITYPPLMPNEFLYKHHRVYKTYHSESGPTRTSVHWR
jgi:hypothetical protein